MMNATSEIREREHELKSLLAEQPLEVSAEHGALLERAKSYASGFAFSTEGIAVISDFRNNRCHIYAGKFGQTAMRLPEYSVNTESAFEDSVFDRTDRNKLLERHILELRFYGFLKNIPAAHKTDYQASCLIGFDSGGQGSPATILHTTRYLHCDADGNAMLGLCTYIPFPQAGGKYRNAIVNIATGECVGPERYDGCDCTLLSKRQLEILELLARGTSSKQIAARLNISQFTVNRHRQDILSRLKVTNTAAAVEIGLRMGLIE